MDDKQRTFTLRDAILAAVEWCERNNVHYSIWMDDGDSDGGDRPLYFTLTFEDANGRFHSDPLEFPKGKISARWIDCQENSLSHLACQARKERIKKLNGLIAHKKAA